MNVRFLRTYRSKAGNPTFVYSVKGTESDLEAFADIQGEYHRTDDKTGDSLWFTTRFIGKHGTLIITPNGKIVPDMSAFDQAASIAAQYGGNFGQALADKAAMSLLGGNSAMQEVPAAKQLQAPAEEPAEEPAESDLGDLG